MNKKLVCEGIFIIILGIALSYFIFAALTSESPVTVVVGPAAVANNSNLSYGNSVGQSFEINFTCIAGNITAGVDSAPHNMTLLANFNSSSTLTNRTFWTLYNFNNTYKKLNATFIFENGTVGFNVSNTSLDVTGWVDGVYFWSCMVGYNNGTNVLTPSRVLTIDRAAPITRFLTPNNTWISNNTNGSTVHNGTALNWQITGNVSDTTWTPNCSLTSDIGGTWAINYSHINITISGTNVFVINQSGNSGFNGGILFQNWSGYILNLSCADSANHTTLGRLSYIRVKVDGEYVTGNVTTLNSSVVSSGDYSNWSAEDFKVSVKVTDKAGAGDVANGKNSSGVVNCSLYGDFTGAWAWNQTVAVVENTVTNFTAINLSTNSSGYRYMVSCMDLAGNFKNITDHFGNALLSTIKVDSGAPAATISSSAGTALNLGQTTTLSCAASDDYEVASTDINLCSSGQSSCVYTMAGTTSQTATCTVTDHLSHVTSSSITLSTGYSGAAGGGGGGGGGGTATTTDISETPTTVTSTGIGEVIPLAIAGENYNLEVESIGLTSTTITIADQTVSLVLGETKEVDLNSDGTNDISITLNSVADKKPQFTIKEIALQARGAEEITIPKEIQEKISGLSPIKIGLIVLSIAIILVIIICLIERRK